MRALVIEEFGGPEVFTEIECEAPKPGPGQVLVEVQATSVNPIDTKVRSGAVPAIAPGFPAILHADVAGVIAEVGLGVDDLVVGQRVMGCAGGFTTIPGALAQFMACDRRLVTAVPDASDLKQAAAVPLVGITATEVLDRLRVTANDTVLVCGGAGGVGHVLIQLAVARGARVIATASTDAKLQLAQDCGAEVVVDYRTETAAEELLRICPGGFAKIADLVGGDNLSMVFSLLAAGGEVATIAARSSQDLSPLHARAASLHCVFMLQPLLSGQGRQRHQHILATLADLMDKGKLKPVVDAASFSIPQVARAHAHLEAGKGFGKIVCVGW